MWEVYLEKAGAASKVRFVLSGYYDEIPEYANSARSRCLRAFWSEHLLTWLPAFAGLVTKNADTTLYRGVGLLLAEEARRWTALTR